jgi:hypothetical protein
MECAMVGMAESSTCMFVQTRFSNGWRPVSRELREGTQMGDAQYALSMTTPRAASLSRLGVCTTGSP